MVALALGCGTGSGGDAEQVKALSTQVAELRGRIAQLGGEVDNPGTSSQQEPAPPAIAEGHNILKEWEGRGRKLTEPFTIEKIPWSITWTLRAGLFGTFLKVSVYRPGDETPTELAIDTGLEGTDTTFVYESGTFYLEIDGVPKWAIRVTQASTDAHIALLDPSDSLPYNPKQEVDVFDALSEKLNGVLQRLGNKGRLTEKDVDEALREVRMALLEADVNFRVARDFVARLRERALQEDVLGSLSPGQQVVKITNEELTAILGGGVRTLEQAPSRPGAILIVGLNGSGKTTTAAKLARYLKQSGQTPVLVAADLQRPAAVHQLRTLGKQIGVEVYEGGNSESPVDVAHDGIKRAAELEAAWAIVDTAGRLQIDDELMAELEDMKSAAAPTESLLVVDAMTGQDAVQVAQDFHRRIGLTGLILTKLDGDARGGAALSITSITGVPIKFIGTGERVDALEQFHPDRLASRILGMGDMLSLIEKAQASFDQQQVQEMEKKIRQATFDLEDFLGQLQQLKSMGPVSQVLEMIPGFSGLQKQIDANELDGGHMERVEAIIHSMTAEERQRPEIIGGSRRRRIARGSGTNPQDVNLLLNQFRQMQKLMRQMTSGKGQRKLMRLMGQRGGPFNI